jgi:hypothetical protein
MRTLVRPLVDDLRAKNAKYVEFRPLNPAVPIPSGFSESQHFYFHQVDLRPQVEILFSNLHKNSFQRKVHRALRERISYEKGASPSLVEKFYKLFVMTPRVASTANKLASQLIGVSWISDTGAHRFNGRATGCRHGYFSP